MMMFFGAKESFETEASVTHSSNLLDTDIETDVCALGITEKSTSAEIVGEDVKGQKPLTRVNGSTLNAACAAHAFPCEKCQPQTQLFDFVHIRYQRSGIQDGARIFRLAFEQTKPGGWIEVVETGLVSAPGPQHRYSSRSNAVEGSKGRALRAPVRPPPATGPSEATAIIKRQLLEAGFVDVEEKGWRPNTSTAGICHKIAGVGKFLKSWCLGFLGVRWNCESGSTNAQVIDEKASTYNPSRIFIIARRP
ncbi:hypothetical protein BDZ91DRAFT_41639 [Kalaharituber pfeilii]|nr:hypothetical protein BDZ91DRAFT_41639 [Kalaharituber pfeilii]